jgi:hypothetical protein
MIKRFSAIYWIAEKFLAGLKKPSPSGKKLHVCYALSLDDDTAYADLITISARSVTRIYPASRITILTDDESLAHFGNSMPGLLNVSLDIKSVGTYAGPPRLRSRFVKTQVRNVLDGDFLYIDADTVAVSRFDEILECDAPISAAIDRNLVNPAGGFPNWVVPDFDRLGWRHPTRVYLNAGVVFWKDCDQARALGQLWHQNWLYYTKTVDNPADQPAFNHSIDELRIEPEIMRDAFNSRIGVSPEFAKGARIYHFYIEGENKPEGTIIDELLMRYRRTGQVDFSLIDSAQKRGHPWLGEAPLPNTPR